MAKLLLPVVLCLLVAGCGYDRPPQVPAGVGETGADIHVIELPQYGVTCFFMERGAGEQKRMTLSCVRNK